MNFSDPNTITYISAGIGSTFLITSILTTLIIIIVDIIYTYKANKEYKKLYFQKTHKKGILIK
jgi:uncharacterized membrane protein (DUF485 family)